TLTLLRDDLAVLRWAGPLFAGDAVRLPPERIVVDVATFERLSETAEPVRLERAAALYRGELLEGIGAVGEPFEGWLGGERAWLGTGAGPVWDRILATKMAAGATLPAIRAAMRVLRVDPAREDVHRLLMRLHAREGRRAAAIRQYQTCAAVLRRELDVAPE